MSNLEELSQRKKEHLELALRSQTFAEGLDSRFNYEPLLAATPTNSDELLCRNFLGFKLRAPLWISSMTGGTGTARHINQNLAKACHEFGLGMGLGSCRSLLDEKADLSDFNLRPIIGDSLPLFANLGICQLEELLLKGEADKIIHMVERLQADGLIIHINPLQEWFQPEGDSLKQAPIITIESFLKIAPFKVIVKEVGQGFGPQSMEALMKLPLAAIEFSAFGGTNFSQLELLRSINPLKEATKELALVGHTADEMIKMATNLVEKLGTSAMCREFIISGGVQSFLHGHYLTQKLGGNCLYGQAKAFLEHARGDYKELQTWVQGQIDGLAMAHTFLTIKN